MSCCYWRASATLHVDVSDDAECGLFQRKVELTISDWNVQAKPKDDVFQYSTEDGLKTIWSCTEVKTGRDEQSLWGDTASLHL